MRALTILRSRASGPSGELGPLTVALAGMLMMAAAKGIGRFAYTPLLPPMMDALSWTVSQAGDVASSNFLGYVIGALLASVLVQRAGRRRWLGAEMVLSAVTTAAGAWVMAFPVWLAVRFLPGLASAFCLVLGTTLGAALLLVIGIGLLLGKEP